MPTTPNTFESIAKRIAPGGIGLTEFLSLVSFRTEFSLTREDVQNSAAQYEMRKKALTVEEEANLAIAKEELEKLEADKASSEDIKRVAREKVEARVTELGAAVNLIPDLSDDGRKFNKFFGVIQDQKKKFKEAYKGKDPQEALIAHLAEKVLPRCLVLKQAKKV